MHLSEEISFSIKDKPYKVKLDRVRWEKSCIPICRPRAILYEATDDEGENWHSVDFDCEIKKGDFLEDLKFIFWDLTFELKRKLKHLKALVQPRQG